MYANLYEVPIEYETSEPLYAHIARLYMYYLHTTVMSKYPITPWTMSRGCWDITYITAQVPAANHQDMRGIDVQDHVHSSRHRHRRVAKVNTIQYNVTSFLQPSMTVRPHKTTTKS